MNLPSGIVTFLFTDIEGSTRLWEEQPDIMRRTLHRHDFLLRAIIEQNGGCVFKTVGDAFCAAFHTALNALKAALAAQQALTAEVWEEPVRLKVRMALHTGHAEVHDNDYFGQSLNRVERLLSVGYGGQTLISAVTQGLVYDILLPSVSLKAMGEHRLRDLSLPETVFQLLHPDLPSEFPPLKSLNNPLFSNNLPVQVTSFIGREKDIVQVKSLLETNRLLTLTGSGGCGKTRLALQVAADGLEQFPDGVWLVELAPLSDPTLVPQAVASVLGVKEQPGLAFQQTLTEYLKTKHLLLLLDNGEHLLTACTQLTTALLRSCPQVMALVTSREPLRITGEQTYRVPSLSLPDPKRTHSAQSLSQYEAVRLFVERASQVKSDFAVTEANSPALTQVCVRLDGIPLAIELAAARARSLSLQDINTRLDNRFRLLTGGDRATMPRQQTLRALIDWSYDLLNAQERLLLARLSVFAGGWTLEAAEQVGADAGAGEKDSSPSPETQNLTPVEDWEVLSLLLSLVDKSLVIAATQGEGTRYRLLETVRQYARDRLAESGEVPAVRGRHRDYFLTLALEIEPKLTGSEQANWLSVLEEEHDNLRAALTFSQEEPSGGEQGLRLGKALWKFWEIRGHLSEGRERLQAALAHPGAQERTTTRAAVLTGAGELARRQGDYVSARSLHQESLTIQQELGNRQGIGVSLNSLGILAALQGDYMAARPLCQESLAIQREFGDKRGIAVSLNSLGIMAAESRDYAVARALHEEALAIRQELGDKWGIGASLNNLGIVADNQGDYAAARSLYEESLAIHRELGSRTVESSNLAGLGNVAYFQGDYAAAGPLYEESLAIRRELGDRWGVALALHNLGAVRFAQGDYALARALYAESLEIQYALEDKSALANSLEAFASLALKEGSSESAARLWGAASMLREAISSPLPPNKQKKQEREVAAARETLGEEAFASAWAHGRAMTMEQAVQYALRFH